MDERSRIARTDCASEPLTLDEEYDMQKSWRNDKINKCTLLVLSKNVYNESKDEIGSLICDTTLFLSEDNNKRKVAEAEIMIAEKQFRGQHLGWEAKLLMLQYGVEEL